MARADNSDRFQFMTNSGFHFNSRVTAVLLLIICIGYYELPVFHIV
jgi:hypothetical protein